ncbi:DUF6755 family protein [Catalinimonas niigatensis]|uniref:DUF6755 family protein n=1 Tax=Catalinimonas niigatensis TaxID=1397264 RepID=UPI0026653AD7|nr:DUF6755 family protein [Catalinimonas niigatensis]WPP47993.1 DUF6755 family protein [Catalinimonas niigatensis]
MSDFREAQDQAHPNKTNTLMLGIIMLLIGILSIQIWLLYSALNNALDENEDIAIAAFVGSLILFFTGLWLLKYLPDTRRRVNEEEQTGSKYQ